MRRLDSAAPRVLKALRGLSFALSCVLAPLLHAQEPSPPPLRFTQADMLQEEGGSLGLPPALVPVEGPFGAWVEVALPHVSLARAALPSAAQAARVVTTWYRLRLDDALAANPHLYLPRWQTIGQIAVYGDGKLLFNSRGDPVWNGFNHPLWIPLAGTAGAEPPRTLLIRLSSERGTGGGIASVWVGAARDLMWRYRVRAWLQNEVVHIASAAFLAIGLFSLVIWAFRRRESIYGLFFAGSLFFYVRCLHFYWGLEPLPFPEDWFGWATVNSLGWLMITIYFFGLRLHGRHYPWPERIFVGLMAFSTLIMLPPVQAVPPAALVAPLAYLAMLAGGILVLGTAMWSAWRSQSRDALVLASWNFSTLPLGVHDLLLQGYQLSLEQLYLTPYVGIGNFVIFLVIVSRRYNGALVAVEQANERLELRLRQREAELTASHERLRAIEYEQTISQERRRLTQDMHDGLGSSLMSALRMVEGGGIDATDVARVLQECIDDLKLTIDSMEPVASDLLLLLATLRFRLAPRLEYTGLSLRWEVAQVPALAWLNPRTSLHILRILQEAFTNAIKHAQASEIHVSTHSDDEGVTVFVSDNGRGLPPDAFSRGGKGLANLKQRAQAIGARLHWDAPGQGTRFQLWLPLRDVNG
jgi:signal transduction histidine kinase